MHRDVHGFDPLAPAEIRQIYDKRGANDIRANAPNQIDTRLAGTASCDQIVYQQYTFARFYSAFMQLHCRFPIFKRIGFRQARPRQLTGLADRYEADRQLVCNGAA